MFINNKQLERSKFIFYYRAKVKIYYAKNKTLGAFIGLVKTVRIYYSNVKKLDYILEKCLKNHK